MNRFLLLICGLTAGLAASAPPAAARPAAAILADYKTAGDALRDQQQLLDPLVRDLDTLDDLPPPVTADPPARPITPHAPAQPQGEGLTLLGITSGAPDPREVRVLHARQHIAELWRLTMGEQVVACNEFNKSRSDAVSRAKDYKSLKEAVAKIEDPKEKEKGFQELARQRTIVGNLIQQSNILWEKVKQTRENEYQRALANPDYVKAYDELVAAFAASPRDKKDVRILSMEEDHVNHMRDTARYIQAFNEWMSHQFP